MTAPGRYAASDGSLARSTGNAAARGGVLIAVAVVIGFLLLWKGGVGGDNSAAVTDDGSGDDSSQADDAADDASADDAGSDDAGSDDAGADDAGADDAGTGDDTETTVPATPTTRPLGEVKVVVANGQGIAGLAGARTEVLSTAGYVAIAKNAAQSPTEISAVYYLDGYAEEARGVAEELGGSLAVLRPSPADPLALVADATGVEDFHIFVVLGSDTVLG